MCLPLSYVCLLAIYVADSRAASTIRQRVGVPARAVHPSHQDRSGDAEGTGANDGDMGAAAVLSLQADLALRKVSRFPKPAHVLGELRLCKCPRYAIKALFRECRWEECIEIYQRRRDYSFYKPQSLDQVTVHRIIKAYGHLDRWIDAIEFLAEFVQERRSAVLLLQSSGPSGQGHATGSPATTSSSVAPPSAAASVSAGKVAGAAVAAQSLSNIDLVLRSAITVLVDHGQAALVSRVIERVIQKGFPLSVDTLAMCLGKTSTEQNRFIF
jgi:hypothetical protein